jgi:hypothetical protein
MTAREINQAIKRLNKSIATGADSYIQNEARKEFLRLYNSDNTFYLMNKDGLKTMLKLNLRHRFVPLHTFGLFIEI